MGVPAVDGQVREFLSCAPGFCSSAAVSVACVDVEYRVPCDSLTPSATRPAGRPGDAGSKTRGTAGVCSDLAPGGEGLVGAPSQSAGTPHGPSADAVAESAWPLLRCRSILEQQAVPALDPGLHKSLLRLHDLRRSSHHQNDACSGGRHASAPVFASALQCHLLCYDIAHTWAGSLGVVGHGAARDTDHPLLVGYQVRRGSCVVTKATCQGPAQRKQPAVQEDHLEFARGAVRLSRCTPFQPVAVPKTVTFYLLCPLALVEEARLFLQVLSALPPTPG